MRSSSSKEPAVGNDIFRNLSDEDVEDGSTLQSISQNTLELRHMQNNNNIFITTYFGVNSRKYITLSFWLSLLI